MSFSRNIEKQLSAYKAQRLGIKEHGRTVSGMVYPYILPKPLRQLNVMESIRREFLAYRTEISGADEQALLSPDFHYLTSSQAMAFNLFFPFLVTSTGTQLLQSSLGLEQDRVVASSFEKILDAEEQLTFSFWMELESGKRVGFITLFAEETFGSILKPNPGDVNRFRDVYSKQLQGKVPDMCLRQEVFFDHYQIMRAVSHLDLERGDHLFLIFPEANDQLVRHESEIGIISSGALGGSMTMLHLEDVVQRILDASASSAPFFASHYLAFKEKYFLTAPAAG
jgi:hypothetical protein